MKRILLLAILSITFGCSSKVYEFTFASTKEFDRSKGFKKVGKVYGADKRYIVLFFPTGTTKMENAVDRALNAVPNGCALTDVKFYSVKWYIPYIYGQYGWVVEGTALTQ